MCHPHMSNTCVIHWCQTLVYRVNTDVCRNESVPWKITLTLAILPLILHRNNQNKKQFWTTKQYKTRNNTKRKTNEYKAIFFCGVKKSNWWTVNFVFVYFFCVCFNGNVSYTQQSVLISTHFFFFSYKTRIKQRNWMD